MAGKLPDLPFGESSSPPLMPEPAPRLSREAAVAVRRNSRVGPRTEPLDADVSEPGFRAAHLYVEKGPGAGQLMPLRQGSVSIGRASASDLRLLHPSISRHHAEITRRGERFHVRDMGSQNGTFLNRQRVTDEVELKPNDTLSVGQATLRLRVTGDGEEESSIVRILRHRWNIARWAVFTAAVMTGFAGVALVQLYRVTGVPVVEVMAQAEPASFTPPPAPHFHSNTRPLKTAVHVQRTTELEVPPEATEPPVRSHPHPLPPPSPVRHTQHVASAAPVIKVTPAATTAHPAEIAPASTTPSTSNLLAELEPTDTVLARYEGGDAAGALELAKRLGDTGALRLLTRFRGNYTEAQKALGTRDVSTAKHEFQSALEIDQQLAHGRGWYHAEIRRHLSQLHTQQGDRDLSRDDLIGARQAYREALALNPGNHQAKTQLEALQDDSISKAPLKVKPSPLEGRANEIEEAFESP